MKTILLAGGFGSRLGEYTDVIPKPMVTIGGTPIIQHIMERFAQYGHKDFVLALGYKSEVIKDYFINYRLRANDLEINLMTGQVIPLHQNAIDWKIALVDTGLNTMTGGRLKRLQNQVGNERFFLTYGDGLANIDLEQLLNFHCQHGKMVTISAVHPSARFGELILDGDEVSSFQEKPQTASSWINGGFMVVEPEFLEMIQGDETILEREPLETVAANGQLMAFRHEGYWQCMDTKRDRDALEEQWLKGDAPWTQ